MESFIGNNFFQNPFGGGMNPIGGGGNGVLENIQQQVTDNGQALKSLQGGIGGLPSGNLPPGGIGGGHRGPGSPGTVKPSPIQGGFVPEPPPDFDRPGGETPPDFGKLDLFGPINPDELNKQNPGIEQGFFESDEYNKFHYDPGNMMGTMDAVFSKYFGGQGSGSISRAQDAAYEAYLKRIGKSDLIGKNVSGLPNNIFNLNGITQPIPGSSNFTSEPESLSPVDPFRTPNMNTMEIGNVGNTRMAGPVSGMDPLFGRAFAGKPV
jgi:hypothetical protein